MLIGAFRDVNTKRKIFRTGVFKGFFPQQWMSRIRRMNSQADMHPITFLGTPLVNDGTGAVKAFIDIA